MSWKLYEGDCLEIMPTLQDDSFDLIILDPPYNINKAEWDKIGSHTEYLSFIERVMCECERLLKDNGSLYLWHNQFPVLSDFQYLIKDKTRFVFKQMIVWNKRFNECKNKGFFDGFIETNQLRNYQQMAEYLLFYTFQDETGLNQVLKQDGFYNLMDYFKQEREKLGWNYNECDEFLGIKASYCYWDKPTTHPYRIPEEKHYLKLQSTGFFKREYEDLRREYEDLRREYEDLRYTFNNQKTHHSIWNYETESGKHTTQKPISLSENIIKHSSNTNDQILIPFAGSGSEMIASINLNRNVTGIEQNPEYCQLIRERLHETTCQTKLTKPIPSK